MPAATPSDRNGGPGMDFQPLNNRDPDNGRNHGVCAACPLGLTSRFPRVTSVQRENTRGSLWAEYRGKMPIFQFAATA